MLAFLHCNASRRFAMLLTPCSVILMHHESRHEKPSRTCHNFPKTDRYRSCLQRVTAKRIALGEQMPSSAREEAMVGNGYRGFEMALRAERAYCFRSRGVCSEPRGALHVAWPAAVQMMPNSAPHRYLPYYVASHSCWSIYEKTLNIANSCTFYYMQLPAACYSLNLPTTMLYAFQCFKRCSMTVIV
jgi:hypothetical protein